MSIETLHPDQRCSVTVRGRRMRRQVLQKTVSPRGGDTGRVCIGFTGNIFLPRPPEVQTQRVHVLSQGLANCSPQGKLDHRQPFTRFLWRHRHNDGRAWSDGDRMAGRAKDIYYVAFYSKRFANAWI